MTMDVNVDVNSVDYEDMQIDTTTGLITFRGRVLGFATSSEDWHTHPEIDDAGQRIYARPKQRCSGCRWFEVTIFETDQDSEDARYLVLTRGPSIVPGERMYDNVNWTDAPHDVIELLTIRQGGKPTLPKPSARALAQAANRDADIRDAYENRPVL